MWPSEGVKASNPPAEAPTPTMGNLGVRAGGDLIGAGFSAAPALAPARTAETGFGFRAGAALTAGLFGAGQVFPRAF